MKIVYGVSGEGFGHSSRSKEIIEHLIKEENEVLVITYGQAKEILKKFNLLEVKGIHFHHKDNEIKIINTAISGIKSISNNIKNWKAIKEKIQKFNPDLFITDFEPTTSFLSYSLKKPLISIDNQHTIKYSREIKRNLSYQIAKIVTYLCVPRANHHIILSCKEEKTNNKITFVKPVIRKEIKKLKIKEGKFILVYFSKENKSIIPILRKIKNQKFVVYNNKTSKEYGNIELKKFDNNFINDLARCKATIASTGFSLLSESIYLKKPILGIPLKGQFEQILNANLINELGIGKSYSYLTEERINLFLKNIPLYKDHLKNINTKENSLKEIYSIIKRYEK